MAAFSFDAFPRIVRKPRVRQPRRRHFLELESLEDRTLLSGSSFRPLDVILRPGSGKPADSTDPWPTAFGPSDIASLYGLDQLTTADGHGMTIAIVDAYDDPKFVSRSSTLPIAQDTAFLASDLHQFDVQYNLPEPTGFFTKVDQNGGTNYPTTDPAGASNPNGNWEYEEALDVEWAHAIAPMAHIELVEAVNDQDPNTTPNLFKAIAYAGGQSGAQVVSMSWGDFEWSGELANDSSAFVQPTGYGVTYVAASGDSGKPSLYPSYAPEVLSVGGTTLNQDFFTGAYSSEDGWSGSGGGVSQYELQPNYQKAVVPSSMSLVNGQNWRTSPDVAFDADPQTGVSVYDSYNGTAAAGGPWWQQGGTSYSAVAWAGLIGLTDQLRSDNGLGPLNGPSQTLPTLYKLPASDFHDITTGNNGNAAGPGYDMVTGLGSPIANKLLPDLASQANLQVVTSTPANGASVATPPTQFTITFSDPVNSSTVQASTLTVNGTAANSVMLDSTGTIATFTFTNSPVTQQGKQTMAIAANTVADLGSSNPTNSAYNATFYYDTLPLAVASTTPAAGGAFTLPGSAFTFSVTFNEPIDPSLVSTSNLTVSQGTVSAARVQSGNVTIAYTITGLTSEGALTATLAPGIEDQYDNLTSPSFTMTLYVDNGPVALQLSSVGSPGLLGYQANSSSAILYAGDHDQYTLSADPGETLAVVVKPTSSGLTPTVQLRDPTHAVLGSASGSGPGQNAVLQTVPTTVSGTYTITVGGAGVTTGGYTLQVYLDAALDNASQGGAANNTLATAQNLNSAFLPLVTAVSSASAAAVVGSVAQPVTLTASARGQWDSTGGHDATSSAYEVGQVPPTQYRNYFVFDLSSINLPILSASLNLTDVVGGYSSTQTSDTYGLFDVSTPVSALVASGAGQAGIFNDLGSGTGFGSQTITTSSDGTVISTPLNAAGVSALNSGHGGLFAIGGALTSISGSNTQVLFGSSGNASDTTQLVLTLTDSRFYSFTLNGGEQATVGLKYLTGSGDSLFIEDATGKTLAASSGGNASFDQITNFTASATGTYYVVVSGSSAATYSLVVTRDATLDGKNNTSSSTAQSLTGTAGVLGSLSTSSPTDWYKVTPNASQTLLYLETATPLAGPSQALNTLNLQIQLYDSSNNLVASGNTLPDGKNQLLSAPGLTAGATYYIKVSAVSGQGPYFLSLPAQATTSSTAAKLGFGVQPVNTPTGDVLPAVTVQILDQGGNLVTSDNTDVVTLSIASGPAGGTFLTGSTLTATATGGVATFNNLTLVVPGTYTFGALVPTKYTGPNSSSFTVAPLQVVPSSFQGTPAGFSLQFNAPFLVNSTTPVLYGPGLGSTGVAPSVIVTSDPGNLTDTAAMAVGSLVLNTKTNSITFLATNTGLQSNNGSPVLPDGVYTVIVRSSAANDGFQSLNSGGGFLDGVGNGTPGSGDFKATFTVNAAAAKDDVLWVPSTADGPGQVLNAPGNNQVGGGYPIYLSDTTGKVTSVQVTLNYDPTLLAITGVTGSHLTLLNSSTPGQAMLQYSGPALPSGVPTPLGFITATVPSGSTSTPVPYKAKDLLHLTNVSLNGGAVSPVVTSDGLHLVAYVGDANGDGAYSSDDAVRITRVNLQTDSGFAAYPLVDPVIVADTDGAGFIPADAALQVNEAGVGVKTANLSTPPVPAGVHFAPIANNVDPALSLGSAAWGVGRDGSSVVNVPVNIDDPHPAGSTGLVEGHLALTYDPNVFTVSATDVHLGSVLSGKDWSLVPTIDQTTGQIAIALSSPDASGPITNALGGSLVTIDFHPVGRISTPSSIDLVPSATPSGQAVTTELEDTQGTFTVTFQTTASVVAPATGVILDTAGTSTRIGPVLAAESAGGLIKDQPDRFLPSSASDISSSMVLADPALSDTETPIAPLALVAVAEPLHVAAAASSGPAAPIFVTPTLPTTASLVSLLFQLATSPAPINQSIGAAVWQHGSESLFQAWGRATGNAAASPLSSTGPIWERVLAGQPVTSQWALDTLNSDEAVSNLSDSETCPQPAHRGARQRTEPTVRSSPVSATSDTPNDRAALDQLFAEAMDDSGLTMGDE